MEEKFVSRAQALHKTTNAVSIKSYLFNSCCTSVIQYKAQLFPLPLRFDIKERAAMHAVFHLATNSLDHASFFWLHLAGGPKVQSATVAARAAMCRTAYNSQNIWREWKRQLEVIAIESLSLADLGCGRRWPHWWDSTPIALNLSHAQSSFPGEPRWSVGASAAHNELTGTALPQQSSSLTKKPKIQATFYKQLLPHRFPDKFEKFCSDRLAALLQLDLAPTSAFDLGESFKVLKSIRKHEAFQVIKTGINSWATSRRFDHDEVTLPCIFGCSDGCEDDLAHYLKCTFFWSLIESKISFDIPSTCLERVGVRNPSKRNFHLLAATFQAYHGTKKWLRDLDTNLSTFLTIETNLVSIRRHFGNIFRTSLRGMPGEESAVGNLSSSLFLSVGESLEEVPTDIDFASPEFSVDDHTQVDGSLSLSTRVAGPPVYSRALRDF